MDLLPCILLIILLFLLIINYLYLTSSRNSLEIVIDMGIGYNLGNTFDSYDLLKEINYPEEQIILNGNTLSTKKWLKKYDFKAIQFSVTWILFIDDYGNINSDWMLLIKEVVDLIINAELYWILNIYNDGNYGNWLYLGI